MTLQTISFGERGVGCISCFHGVLLILNARNLRDELICRTHPMLHDLRTILPIELPTLQISMKISRRILSTRLASSPTSSKSTAFTILILCRLSTPLTPRILPLNLRTPSSPHSTHSQQGCAQSSSQPNPFLPFPKPEPSIPFLEHILSICQGQYIPKYNCDVFYNVCLV